ncbi:MAG: MBL fold metallo-hydrolase [Thermoplasmata archaeon]|nr:MBL fold metallo-hydrolase [Thermoplasmata archaeon]
MKVHQVGGINFDSNIYLLETDKPVLFDTGTGWNLDKTLAKIEKVVKLDKINTIILTHVHYDHTGGAADILERIDAEIYVHKDDSEPLIEGDGHVTGADMFGREQNKIDVKILNLDEPLDCGEVEFKMFHTPGHSPGCVSFYDETSKSLICGDVVFTDGGVGRWDLPGGNFKKHFESIKFLNTLDVVNLYTGHGPYNEGQGTKHIQMALRQVEMYAKFEGLE